MNNYNNNLSKGGTPPKLTRGQVLLVSNFTQTKIKKLKVLHKPLKMRTL